MNFYIEKLQKFFASIAKYFSNTGVAFSWLFIIFMGLFGVTTLAVIISSSFSYEYVLSRAIDKINKFLTKNPRINDDNLVAFNNKMKEKRIPKVLRRQWQQFMLYREHEASYYMSFKHCVENPLKNSTYNQQLSVYKTISLILVFLSTLIGVFCTYQTSLQGILKDILIIPIFILVLYWIVSMVLNLIHNATTGDLYQNYQYFEINIDKATVTLPEYVDYEVLFTQEEIRRGIPVLFEYIQKRAIEEQKELERARIKNVEHEKFNFDASGMDASLVLERSMQEAEDYIATRKKYMQDIEQVNNEISALENQYKENVKENQRLMQTSKESIDALKKQLEQATSSIEINYIKKQMKDEINRQQIAERDFDTLTDKHNKEIKELQEEVNRIQGEIEKAKQALETVMMSEFSTYSTKVYKKIESAVGEDQKEVINGYKKQINDLEEKLALKDEELDNVYKQYQSQIAKMEEKAKDFDSILKEKDDFISQVQDQLEEGKTTKSKNRYKKNQSENVNLDTERKDSKTKNSFIDDNNNLINNEEDTNLDSVNTQNFELDNKDDNNDEGFNYFDNEDLNSDDFDNANTNDFEDADNTGEDLFNDNNDLDFKTSENNNFDSNDGFNFDSDTEEKFNYLDSNNDEDNDDSKLDKNDETFNYLSDDAEEQHHEKSDKDEDNEDDSNGMTETFNYLPNSETTSNKKDLGYDERKAEKEKLDSLNEEDNDETSDEDGDVDNLFKSWIEDDGENDESTEGDEFDEDEEFDETNDGNEEIEESNDEEPEEDESESSEDEEAIEDLNEEEYPEQSIDAEKPKRKAGRPRKIIDEDDIKPKRKVGRPKKVVDETEVVPKRKVGRPKKEVVEPKRSVGRPKKAEVIKAVKVGRPRKTELELTNKVRTTNETGELKRKVGRPSTKTDNKQESQKAQQTEKKRKVGRPANAKKVGRPKKAKPVGRPKKANPVGRPKKQVVDTPNLNEIDKRLKELNEQIKKENQNLEKTKRQLEKVNLKKKKK